MRKYKQRITFSLLIFSMFYGITMAADSPCGDWKPYKDEKCFKVLDNLETEENAEKTCNKEDNNATLITIGSNDEQNFLSNHLFGIHKVVDAIWIGAKKSNNTFKWADDSDVIFSNWAGGYPNNKEDNTCVEMMPEILSMGKWLNEPCNKRNLVVCQKIQVYPCSILQEKLLDTRKLLDYITLFSDSLGHFKIFSDNNNRLQVLIHIHETIYTSREDAIAMCKKFSASLVKIESSEKQLIVRSFLDQIPNTPTAIILWLGGYKDSDGKLKWMSNGTQISFTNWAPNEPNSSGTYISIDNNKASVYGKWYMSSGKFGVICETSFSS